MRIVPLKQFITKRIPAAWRECRELWYLRLYGQAVMTVLVIIAACVCYVPTWLVCKYQEMRNDA